MHGGDPSSTRRLIGRLLCLAIGFPILTEFSFWPSSVFPVERNVRRPGFIAFFVRPNPFEVNNTALYQNQITTRRPWASTMDPNLMAEAKNNLQLYNTLKEERFLENKKMVKDEISRRAEINVVIEAARRQEEIDQSTAIESPLDKT